MLTRKQRKLVHEGQYLAEVDVELIESDDGWSPSLTPTEARKLDEVRTALRRGDVAAAAKFARIYRITPINAA
ncbi:MAG: hypothetical protein ABSB74_19225 [Tepidisphaeraceae bacterium]